MLIAEKCHNIERGRTSLNMTNKNGSNSTLFLHLIYSKNILFVNKSVILEMVLTISSKEASDLGTDGWSLLKPFHTFLPPPKHQPESPPFPVSLSSRLISHGGFRPLVARTNNQNLTPSGTGLANGLLLLSTLWLPLPGFKQQSQSFLVMHGCLLKENTFL